MKHTDRYPELSKFLQGYLGEEFDLWGDTIEEIVAAYRSESQPPARLILVGQIDQFCRDHALDLDTAFKAAYGLTFNPVSWGHTTASFFEEVKRLLNE
ncbi:contact-dependent growth inhibition system immunity protein [Paraburkholderia susongensis]|uniref:contact-dependent growth inhibition system immunity protein n=1 Tax=Paraburkholderia susongensis TaxID=1515439 RepID=UPI001180F21B|nr:contact-dependent growth inhibition system immunity protein [Paraburkholderia susongensis]